MEKVEISSSSGMGCYYYKDSYNENTKPIIDKEVEDFRMFFDEGDFHWEELTDDENVYEFFCSCKFIRNDFYNGIRNLVSSGMKFVDAYNTMRKVK